MPIPVVVPRLGWTMEQGVFVEWLKRDGDSVRAGEPIFVLEGEKATQDIESTDSGTLKIPTNGPRPGETVAVGSTVGYLLEAGETWNESSSAAPAAAAADTPSTAPPATGSVPTVGEAVTASVPGSSGSVRQPISPRARRIATELGVDWSGIVGTGTRGRIRESDIRAAAETAAVRSTSPVERPAVLAPTAGLASNARRTIADRMLFSAQQTAAVTLTTQVDATHLVALRKQFKAAAADAAEVVPSLTDILVKLAAVALKEHPEVNSRWDDDRIITSDEVHIGIAVDTPQALLVPVLRSVTRLTLRQVAVRSRDLIDRARNRKVAVAELQGGTFTVTNLGMFGVDAFTPLLNPPQAAILGVGRITREPAVIDEHIVARDRMTLSLTFDHRIIDGAPAARFLDSLSRLIVNPAPALIV